MSGLIDSATGLRFGSGLQFQTKIGGSGLVIASGVFTPVFNVPLTGGGGGSNVTICDVILGPFTKSGSQVRLTLQASAAYAIQSMWAGSQGAGNPYDFDGTQVRFTVAGSTSFTVPIAPAVLVTDAIPYSFVAANNFVVAWFGPTGFSQGASVASVTRYFNASGDVAAVTNKAAGFGSSPGSVDLVTEIEVFG